MKTQPAQTALKPKPADPMAVLRNQYEIVRNERTTLDRIAVELEELGNQLAQPKGEDELRLLRFDYAEKLRDKSTTEARAKSASASLSESVKAVLTHAGRVQARTQALLAVSETEIRKRVSAQLAKFYEPNELDSAVSQTKIIREFHSFAEQNGAIFCGIVVENDGKGGERVSDPISHAPAALAYCEKVSIALARVEEYATKLDISLSAQNGNPKPAAAAPIERRRVIRPFEQRQLPFGRMIRLLVTEPFVVGNIDGKHERDAEPGEILEVPFSPTPYVHSLGLVFLDSGHARVLGDLPKDPRMVPVLERGGHITYIIPQRASKATINVLW